MKRVLCAAAALVWASACGTGLRSGDATGSGSARARNVVLFIGDGMGVSTVTAARILEGQLRGESGEENWLSFEQLPHLALVKTYNTDQQVPDSAGTMTAMMTGRKTRAGLLNVRPEVARGDHRAVAGRELVTLLEQAEQRGLSTGVVTTTELTHATPAGCYAHSPERGWSVDRRLPPAAREADFPDIARQLIEFSHGDGLEVALGGGRGHFLPNGERDPEHTDERGRREDGRDLTAEWTRRPASAYVWNLSQFEAIDPARTDHLLGLFEPGHMRFEADRPEDRAGEPSLSQMTAKAIEILARNEKGFFLMVEGGRIDHGHHLNNAYRALTDTIELSNAVRATLDRVDLADTLVVVTADHSHVFTMGGYATRGNDILGVVVQNGRRLGEGTSVARDALGLPYTTLGYANGPGYTGASDRQPEGPKRFLHEPREVRGVTRGRPDLTQVDTSAPSYLQEAAVPIRRETHSGEDVAVYAGGPGAHRVRGAREQSFVYDTMVEALGWPAANAE